jgi:hypothetical protein
VTLLSYSRQLRELRIQRQASKLKGESRSQQQEYDQQEAELRSCISMLMEIREHDKAERSERAEREKRLAMAARRTARKKKAASDTVALAGPITVASSIDAGRARLRKPAGKQRAEPWSVT